MNVPDFLKKYTSASRKRVTHTEQLKLRDKEKKWNQNVWVDGISQEKIPTFKNEDNGKNAKLSKMKSFGFGGDKIFHIGWRQSLSRFCYI